MLNKFEALRYFCTAAETLNFRTAALQINISPSVISRVIGELETELGEPLFRRNTRQIALTHFGESFYLQAKQLLNESEKLFLLGKQTQSEMAGTVRITLPHFHQYEQILRELLTALKPYPELVIDWRVDISKLDDIEQGIDIGIRIGREPNPNFIVKYITQSRHLFVASPEFLAEYGMPRDFDDMARCFPFSNLINPATKRPWDLHIDTDRIITPHHTNLICNSAYSELQSALAGRSIAQLSNLICQEYLDDGRLVVLFPEIPVESWHFYLYRPYQAVTPPRVLKVFELLEKILLEKFA